MTAARALAWSAIAAAALGGRAEPPAPQAEPYRGATNLVSIYATATDAAGRLVTDLTKADFVVKDNGRKQPIALFSNEVQPITVVILLDRSGSMDAYADVVSDAATGFITRLLPADRARVGRFASEIQLGPEAFTADHAALTAALRAPLPPGGGSPIWTAIDRSITALLASGGRRVVLLFTDGENQPARGHVVTDLKDVIWRARYNDVMVYTVGFLEDDDRPAIALPGRGGKLGGGASRTVDDRRAARAALADLAAQTGGGYFEMRRLDDLSAAFARVADELHRQYWLGIKPAALDNTMHKLEVTVERQKVKVQARKGYFAGSFVR